MLRITAIILAVLLTSAPRLSAMASQTPLRAGCASVCERPAKPTGCCTASPATTGCPMSGGPCQCGVAPADDQRPLPDAPQPRTERDSITGLPNGPPTISMNLSANTQPAPLAPREAHWLSGRGHNEIRSLLGIWRT